MSLKVNEWSRVVPVAPVGEREEHEAPLSQCNSCNQFDGYVEILVFLMASSSLLYESVNRNIRFPSSSFNIPCSALITSLCYIGFLEDFLSIYHESNAPFVFSAGGFCVQLPKIPSDVSVLLFHNVFFIIDTYALGEDVREFHKFTRNKINYLSGCCSCCRRYTITTAFTVLPFASHSTSQSVAVWRVYVICKAQSLLLTRNISFFGSWNKVYGCSEQ